MGGTEEGEEGCRAAVKGEYVCSLCVCVCICVQYMYYFIDTFLCLTVNDLHIMDLQ